MRTSLLNSTLFLLTFLTATKVPRNVAIVVKRWRVAISKFTLKVLLTYNEVTLVRSFEFTITAAFDKVEKHFWYIKKCIDGGVFDKKEPKRNILHFETER